MQELAQTKKSTQELRDCCSKSGCSDTEPESSNQDQVKCNICGRGNHQVDQRMSAVPKSLKNSHEEVVHDKAESTHKIDSEVHQRIHEYFIGCAHKVQNLRRGYFPDQGDCDSAAETESDRCVNGPPQCLHIAGTEVFSDDHTCTDGDTVEESDKKHDQTSGRTDGGKCVTAQKITHDQSVGRVVKLLEQMSPEKRNCKKYDSLPDRALCHAC